MESHLHLLHNVTIEVFGADGRCKQSVETHNLVVTKAKEAIAKLLKEGTERPTYIGVGTGTTEVEASQTALTTQKVRKSATVSVSGAVVTLEKEFAAGEAEGAITEEGVFAEASGGTMYARTKFSAVNIGSEDTLKITHKITVG